MQACRRPGSAVSHNSSKARHHEEVCCSMLWLDARVMVQLGTALPVRLQVYKRSKATCHLILLKGEGPCTARMAWHSVLLSSQSLSAMKERIRQLLYIEQMKGAERQPATVLNNTFGMQPLTNEPQEFELKLTFSLQVKNTYFLYL